MQNKGGGFWEKLPDVCLQHAFRFLPDRDRCRAALVCRRWRGVMRSPRLWRSRYFRLSGRLSKYKQSEYWSAVGYVRSLGVHLERLEVCVCPPQTQMMAQRLQRTICGLFTELFRVNAPLRSLSFERLDLSQSTWDSGFRNRVLNSLIQFFHCGPSTLTTISLAGMQTDMHQGLELLSALQHHQTRISPRCCISALDLKGFFCTSVPAGISTSLAHFLQHLKGLTYLGLSFSCLSDELLMALQQRHEGSSLQTLSLLCAQNEPPDHLVSRSSWSSLVWSCRDLKVNLSLEQVINTERLVNILLPEIPLKEFDMRAFYSPDDNWSAKPLICDLLPPYRRSLQCLSLDLSNFNESLDAELLELVKTCENLMELRVWAFLEIITVETLLHVTLTKGMPLSRVKIRVYSVKDDLKQQEDQLEELLSSSLTHFPPGLHFSAAVCPFI